MTVRKIRDFIRLCQVRTAQDQYKDPDAFRKALIAVETFAAGDEDRAIEILQGSGKDVDSSVWVRAS